MTTSITVFSIALGVLLLVGVDRVCQGTQEGFTGALSQTDLVVGARGGSLPLLLNAVFHIGAPSGSFSFASYEHFRDHPAVQWTIPFSMGDSYRGYRIIATDDNFYEHYRYDRDRSIQFANGSRPEGIFDAAIGSEVAERLGYRVGSTILLGHELDAKNLLRRADDSLTVVGVLTHTATPVDRSIYITLNGEEAMHPADGRQPEHGEFPTAKVSREALHAGDISAFLIRTRSRVDTLLLQREINAYREEPLTAIVPALTVQELWGMLGYADVALSLVSGAVLLVGLLSMLTALYTALNQRRSEVAILRAIGFHTHQIFILFVLESGLISISGVVFGFAAAYGLLWIARTQVEAHFGVPLAMVGISLRVSLYACVVVLVGVLLGCVPAIRASRSGLMDGPNVQ